MIASKVLGSPLFCWALSLMVSMYSAARVQLFWSRWCGMIVAAIWFARVLFPVPSLPSMTMKWSRQFSSS